jgi:RNA polymerase sigma-70 factor (ECF subfamily)
VSREPLGKSSVITVDEREIVSDEALMAAYQKGSTAAFDELVGRYLKELHAFLSRFVGDRALADDILQETFLQVHLSADSFDVSQRFRPWLFTIAANKARDRLRRQARRTAASLDAPVEGPEGDKGTFLDLIVSDTPQPDLGMEEEEVRSLVRSLVQDMPTHLREVLVLSYFHNFSYKEVAKILDVPIGTVKSRLHAAVAHFAQKWRQSARRAR